MARHYSHSHPRRSSAAWLLYGILFIVILMIAIGLTIAFAKRTVLRNLAGIASKIPMIASTPPSAKRPSYNQVQPYSGSRKSAGTSFQSVDSVANNNNNNGSRSARTIVSESDFDEVIKGDAIVAFVSKSCGHCVKFKPVFMQAASSYTGPSQFAIVDAGTVPSLLTRYQIDGVPAVYRFRGGQPSLYSGDRSLKSVLAFAS